MTTDTDTMKEKEYSLLYADFSGAYDIEIQDIFIQKETPHKFTYSIGDAFAIFTSKKSDLGVITNQGTRRPEVICERKDVDKYKLILLDYSATYLNEVISNRMVVLNRVNIQLDEMKQQGFMLV